MIVNRPHKVVDRKLIQLKKKGINVNRNANKKILNFKQGTHPSSASICASGTELAPVEQCHE